MKSPNPNFSHFLFPWSSLVAQLVKNLPVVQDTWVRFRIGKIPWKRKWQPFQAISCLGNPMDRGAWQATVHGVAKIGHSLGTKPPPPFPWYLVKLSMLHLCTLNGRPCPSNSVTIFPQHFQHHFHFLEFFMT